MEDKKFVTMKMLGIILSVFIVVIGWQFTTIAFMNAKVENCTEINTEVKTQLAQIQTDLQWIKSSISKK